MGLSFLTQPNQSLSNPQTVSLLDNAQTHSYLLLPKTTTIPQKVTNACECFYQLRKQTVSGLIFENAIQERNLLYIDFSIGFTQALHDSRSLWSDPSKPTTSSPFPCSKLNLSKQLISKIAGCNNNL